MNASRTTGSRTIPKELAPLIEELELEQPRVVTTRELAEIARALGILVPSPSELSRRLRAHGWLLPLRTKSAWEFIPGARAGRIRSGEAHAELRATLSRRPDFPGQLAHDSATWMHGFANRQPVHEVLALPYGTSAPTAIKGSYRIVRWNSKTPPVYIDSLPTWSVEVLLVAMAVHPSSYHDWPNVLEWLPQAVARINRQQIERELDGEPQSVRTKLAYLLQRGGADAGLLSLVDCKQQRQRPLTYFGPRNHPGHMVTAYNLRDSLLERKW